MGSRSLLNLGLLIVVALLAALAFWEPGKTPPPKAETLTGLDPATIQRVRIARPGQPTIIAERDGAHWQLLAPFEARANGYRFDSLVRVAEAPTRAWFPATGDLEAYGLDAPQVVLELDEVTLRFGATTPVDGLRYLQRDDTVFTVGDTHFYHLVGDVGTFVDRRLLPEGAEVTAIELPGATLARGETGWQVSPEPPDISADAVATWADNWQRARAIEVKQLEGETPEGEIVRVVLEQSAEAIEFIATLIGGERVLVRPDLGLAYHLPESVAQGLFEPPPPPAETDNHE